MAGNEEFFGLEVLHVTLLSLRPQGRSVNNPGFGVPEGGGSSQINPILFS